MSDLKTVKINGVERAVPMITGRKFVRLGKILRTISKKTPEVMKAWAEFTTEYERDNQVEMDRTQALMRFGPTPLYVEGKDDDGNEIMKPALDEKGEVIMAPGRLDHLTDADWQASGNKLRMPTSPSTLEQVAAVFPVAFDAAEDQIVQLLGLMLVDNSALNEAAKGDGIDALLTKEGEKLLDEAPFEELLEILVVAYEAAQTQYGGASERLGDRLGKLLDLVGLGSQNQKSEASETNSQTSSTGSEAPTDGDQTSPSTESNSPSSPPAVTA